MDRVIWTLIGSFVLAFASLVVFLYYALTGQLEAGEDAKYQMLRQKEEVDP